MYENLGANGLHALNLLEPLPLFLLPQEGQQATQPLLTLAMIQLIQVVVPVLQTLAMDCSLNF